MPKPARILCSFGAHRFENWEYWQDDRGGQPPDHHICFQYGVCQHSSKRVATLDVFLNNYQNRVD